MNTLVTEIANVSAKEQALLKQCTDFISLLADMQVASLPSICFFFLFARVWGLVIYDQSFNPITGSRQ